MFEAYLFMIAFFIIVFGFMIYRVIISIKKPPQILTDDYNRDEIPIRVWSSKTRYIDFIFVKRDNGKYRMKIKIRVLLALAASIIQLVFGLFVLYCFKDEFIKNSYVMPAVIAIVIWLFSNIIFVLYSLIEARICFRKALKE